MVIFPTLQEQLRVATEEAQTAKQTVDDRDDEIRQLNGVIRKSEEKYKTCDSMVKMFQQNPRCNGD